MQAERTAKDNSTSPAKTGYITQPWFLSLLLVFTMSIIGIIFSIILADPLPLFTLLGFSIVFSVEHWFRYFTIKHKEIGKLYRVFLNLFILLLLGLIIWSGIRLFSQKLSSSPLFGSLIFLAEFVFFIWMWMVVGRNSWRFPSMKLTVFSLICLFVIFAFAGVQPFSTYKESFLKMGGQIKSEDSTSTEIIQNTLPAKTSSGSSDKTLTIKDKLDELLIGNTEINDYITNFNQYRQSNGCAPLIFTDDLNRVASLRLAEIKQDYSHNSQGNYNNHLAENLVMSKTSWTYLAVPIRETNGNLNNQSALTSWEQSPGHNANMLNKNFKYTGYAIDGSEGFAVQVFSEFPTLNGVPQLPPGYHW